MNVFVINLRKNADRLEKISCRLSKLAIRFERIDAIYGKELTKREKKDSVNQLRWWCTRGYPPRAGEIGAALSHQLAYRTMIENGLPYCCVLEDDTAMDERMPEQLRRIEAWVNPARPQVVLLSNYTKERNDNWAISPTRRDSSAEAYVITRNGAEILNGLNTPICTPSDYWEYWVSKGCIELYHAFPTVIHPEWRDDPNYVSDVTVDHVETVEVAKMNVVQKILWKANRLAGKIIGKVIW